MKISLYFNKDRGENIMARWTGKSDWRDCVNYVFCEFMIWKKRRFLRRMVRRIKGGRLVDEFDRRIADLFHPLMTEEQRERSTRTVVMARRLAHMYNLDWKVSPMVLDQALRVAKETKISFPFSKKVA